MERLAERREGLLSQPTLVLNRSWVAVATTPVRHAVALIVTGAAGFLRPDTYELLGFESWARFVPPAQAPCLRTVRLRLAVPEVVVLTRYDGYPAQTVTFSRRNLFRRDAHTCQYCGSRPGADGLTIDHVVPRSRGGRSSWENCVLACARCNLRKADRTIEEAGLRLEQRPARPRWSPLLDAPAQRVRSSWRRFVPARLWEPANGNGNGSANGHAPHPRPH